MKTRYTEKTVRKLGQWVKITRDNQFRRFTFARGFDNSLSAHDIETYSFCWVCNWSEAINRANMKIDTYA
jgi:hypothetical protein